MQSEELFFTTEWLDTFALNRKEIQIDIAASSLYCVLLERKKLWFNIGYSIPLTPFNAIIEHHKPEMRNFSQFSAEMKLYHELEQKLIRWDAAHIKFKISNLSMPRIESAKIISYPAYTEMLFGPIDTRAIWEGMTTENRKKIIQSQKISPVVKCFDSELILNFLSQNKYYSQLICANKKFLELIDSGIANQSICVFGIYSNNKFISMSLFVRSRNTVYYWMNYNDKSKNLKGGHRAMIWEAIQWAAEQGCEFNFDGSSKEEIVMIHKMFGSKTLIYPNMYYMSNPLFRIIKKVW